MCRKIRIKAFTLLETMVALIVISGSLLLFQAMTQLIGAEIRQQQLSKQQEWLLFADQLETELSRSHFSKVADNKIYLRQDGKEVALGKSRSDDFRKTDAGGRGYQPMIYGLQSASIEQKGSLVYFHFQFEEGLERDYVYRVQEKS